MPALLGLWLSPLACKYSKDLQGQRGEAVPAGWKKPETTDKLRDPPYHTYQEKEAAGFAFFSLLLVSVIITVYP